LKRLLLILLLLSLTLPIVAKAGDIWVSPAKETFLTRETPFNMALGAGTYIAAYEALKLTSMNEFSAKWLAFGIAGFGAWYYQREIKAAMFDEKASFTGIGFSMTSAVLTQHFWSHKKK